MSSTGYKPASIQHAEGQYRAAQLEPRQRDSVNFLGSFVGPRIGMHELPCRGYWVIAVEEWQRQTEK